MAMRRVGGRYGCSDRDPYCEKVRTVAPSPRRVSAAPRIRRLVLPPAVRRRGRLGGTPKAIATQDGPNRMLVPPIDGSRRITLENPTSDEYNACPMNQAMSVTGPIAYQPTRRMSVAPSPSHTPANMASSCAPSSQTQPFPGRGQDVRELPSSASQDNPKAIATAT
jgi:hypothetical protein